MILDGLDQEQGVSGISITRGFWNHSVGQGKRPSSRRVGAGRHGGKAIESSVLKVVGQGVYGVRFCSIDGGKKENSCSKCRNTRKQWKTILKMAEKVGLMAIEA